MCTYFKQTETGETTSNLQQASLSLHVLVTNTVLIENACYRYLVHSINMNSMSKRQSFRFVQIERICRRQNNSNLNVEICVQNGRKTSWEKEKILIFQQCFHQVSCFR